jgi:hypothetical protein
LQPSKTQSESKRRFTRLAAQVPVEIETEQGLLPGTLLDLSRSGVRLKVPGSALGVYRLAPMSLVGRRVAEVLGAEFSARFHPERLGSLLSRRLRPVRLGQRSPASADVELGCVLTPPLTDEEAGMLGLALPVLTSDGSESLERIQTEAPSVRGAAGTPVPAPPPEPPPRQGLQVAVPPPGGTRSAPAPTAPTTEAGPPALRPVLRSLSSVPPPKPAGPGQFSSRRGSEHTAWRAYVHPNGAKVGDPFVAVTEAVSAKGVEIRVLSFQGAAVDGSAGVAATASRLGDVLGSDVALRLVDGATHLWTGPARIEMVEVGPQAPHPVNLWLSFGRQLRPAELRTLGLE